MVALGTAPSLGSRGEPLDRPSLPMLEVEERDEGLINSGSISESPSELARIPRELQHHSRPPEPRAASH